MNVSSLHGSTPAIAQLRERKDGRGRASPAAAAPRRAAPRGSPGREAEGRGARAARHGGRQGRGPRSSPAKGRRGAHRGGRQGKNDGGGGRTTEWSTRRGSGEGGEAISGEYRAGDLGIVGGLFPSCRKRPRYWAPMPRTNSRIIQTMEFEGSKYQSQIEAPNVYFQTVLSVSGPRGLAPTSEYAACPCL